MSAEDHGGVLKTARLSDVSAIGADAAHVQGLVTRHDLIAVQEPPSSGIVVRFEPGSRTHWHRHPDGQYLYVLDGSGTAQSRDSEPIPLMPGVCLYAAPGEEHWHGADPDESLVHLAVSLGVTEWAGPVEAD